MYDPALSTLRRRRARDTVIHHSSTVTGSTEDLHQAIQGLIHLNNLLGAKVDSLRTENIGIKARLRGLEEIINQIGEIR
jgi:hypothetical protein